MHSSWLPVWNYKCLGIPSEFTRVYISFGSLDEIQRISIRVWQLTWNLSDAILGENKFQDVKHRCIEEI